MRISKLEFTLETRERGTVEVLLHYKALLRAYDYDESLDEVGVYRVNNSLVERNEKGLFSVLRGRTRNSQSNESKVNIKQSVIRKHIIYI